MGGVVQPAESLDVPVRLELGALTSAATAATESNPQGTIGASHPVRDTTGQTNGGTHPTCGESSQVRAMSTHAMSPEPQVH